MHLKKWEAAYIAGIMDGEGSITLTKMNKNELRRPCISISSNDIELLTYLQDLVGGYIISKKNYNPEKHENAYTLYIKKKQVVFLLLEEIKDFLRIEKKKKRADWILHKYDSVTLRNGKYNKKQFENKLLFEEHFFKL